jgi:hypothetical protein
MKRVVSVFAIAAVLFCASCANTGDDDEPFVDLALPGYAELPAFDGEYVGEASVPKVVAETLNDVLEFSAYIGVAEAGASAARGYRGTREVNTYQASTDPSVSIYDDVSSIPGAVASLEYVHTVTQSRADMTPNVWSKDDWNADNEWVTTAVTYTETPKGGKIFRGKSTQKEVFVTRVDVTEADEEGNPTRTKLTAQSFDIQDDLAMSVSLSNGDSSAGAKFVMSMTMVGNVDMEKFLQLHSGLSTVEDFADAYVFDTFKVTLQVYNESDTLVVDETLNDFLEYYDYFDAMPLGGQ